MQVLFLIFIGLVGQVRGQTVNSSDEADYVRRIREGHAVKIFDETEALRKLPGFCVRVVPHPSLDIDIVSTSQLRTDTELRLRSLGIELLEFPSQGELQVEVKILPYIHKGVTPVVFYHYKVSLRSLVLDRENALVTILLLETGN